MNASRKRCTWSEISLAVLSGLITSWLAKDAITPFLLSGKNYAGRNVQVQLFLFAAYAVLFSILSLIFIFGFQRLERRYARPRLVPWLRGTAWVLLNSLFVLFFINFAKENQGFYNEFLSAPALSPILISVLAIVFIIPAVYWIKSFSKIDLSPFENHWIIRFFQKNSFWLVIFFSALLVLPIFGRMLAAKWALMDDHEIFYFLGRDGKLFFNEILVKLKMTEVGNFGYTTRYRPVYYLLRLIECAAWGANPSEWYAFRIISLILAVSIFWSVLAPVLGKLFSGLLVAYTLTFGYWTYIFGKLGSGEFYAVFGLAVYVWGFVHAVQAKSNRINSILASLAVCFGGVICMGSKENFLLLMIPSAYIVIRALKSRNLWLILLPATSFLFGLSIATAVLLGVSRAGQDVYSRPVSPFARLQALYQLITTPTSLLGIGVLVFLVFLLIALHYHRAFSKETKKVLRQSAFWMLMLILVYISQLFFYYDSWPTGTHYDYPGMLYIPAAIFILYRAARQIAAEIPPIKYPLLLSRFGWNAALVLFIIVQGYAPVMQELDHNVAATQAFTTRLEQKTAVLKQNPKAAVVLESGASLDFEAIFSYERFLRAYGVENPMFLRIHGYSVETESSSLYKQLTNTLISISKDGNGLFMPLAQLESDKNRCFSINISKNFDTECERLP